MIQKTESPCLTQSLAGRDHMLGPKEAPVTLVEYGDYECLDCDQAHELVKELLLRLGDQISYIFRYFPLSTLHEHAQMAAETAEAAGVQGKFWQMHDILFQNQHALEAEYLSEYAAGIGLDMPQFIRDMATHAHADKVREDFLSGVRSGVSGTPTFFLNGVRLNDSQDLYSLLSAIQEEAA